MSRSMNFVRGVLLVPLFAGGIALGRSAILSSRGGTDRRVVSFRTAEGAASIELQPAFVLDAGTDLSASRGMAKIQGFDLDENRSLYVLGDRSIVQFDAAGRYLRSFGGIGQGPGEFQAVVNILGLADGVSLMDLGGQKLITFSGQGKLLSEIKIPRGGLAGGCLLKNGRFLLAETGYDSKNDKLVSSVSLVSPEFKTLKELERSAFANPSSSPRFEAGYFNVIWRVGGNRIATGFQNSDYRIRVFDLEGNLQHSIERKPPRIAMTNTFRERYLAQFGSGLFEDIKNKIVFPKYLSPYHSFIIDETGRIIVMTPESGRAAGEKWYDIFGLDGRLITRASLPDCSRGEDLGMTIKRGHLVMLETSPDGDSIIRAFNLGWPR
jgi:hypothetical protein